MSGFEIFLDLLVITVGFLLVGRDRNATQLALPQQETPPEPQLDTEAVVETAIAALPVGRVAGSVRIAEVLTFPSRTAETAPEVAAPPAKKRRGRPPGSGKKKLAPAVAAG